MSSAVSVVLPSLDAPELLDENLPALMGELERRAVGDEVIVVDDTGGDVLSAHLAEVFPEVEVVAQKVNTGFARALLAGVERAQNELVFSLNTDVRVRAGFLEPLAGCLEEDDVAAAVPRVLLDGDEDRIESITELRMVDGLPVVEQEALAGRGSAARRVHPFPVAFPVGGAFLFRRQEFLASGGFDALYEPFYWEDVDFGLQAWRTGRRILCHPSAVVEHHHRGTIGKLVPEAVFRAAIERNRLVLAWKLIDDPELLRRHVAALHRVALDAWIGDEAHGLVWLNLALEDLELALAARRALPKRTRSFGEALEAGRPGAL